MGDLILIRHGETEWSRAFRHTSYSDLPLTDNGVEQARAVAKLIDRDKIGTIGVSPMSRARQTAALAGLEPAVTDPDLVEWDYGGYEGLTTPQIRELRPGWDLWTQGVAPGPAGHPGESPDQVGARADRVLDRIRSDLDQPDRPDVLLVAHAHILRVITARRLGLPPSGGALFRLATATLSRLGLEHGRPVITAWNVGG